MTRHDATILPSGQSSWLLANAVVHEAFRRDLRELLATTASRRAVRARWKVFCDQLRFHLGAEDAALGPPVQVKLSGYPADQALIEAMKDEHRLIEPVLAAIDEAFTVNTSTEHLRELQLEATRRPGSPRAGHRARGGRARPAGASQRA